MKRVSITATASIFALIAAMPAMAQDDTAQDGNVDILATWNYDPLYAEGWSVDNMFDETDVIGENGEKIGDVENIIFSNDGQILGIIAQVGGFWDIADTHVFVPWDEVTVENGIAQVRVPVTEDTVDDYDVFGGFMDEEILTESDTSSTSAVDDDLAAGQGIFKATDLIGDYAFLSDGVRYGYVADILVQGDAISAIVSDATAYGRDGYYAYPYEDGRMRASYGPTYQMGFDETQLGTIESFDYTRMQTRLD